jgi:hypothetical protein
LNIPSNARSMTFVLDAFSARVGTLQEQAGSREIQRLQAISLPPQLLRLLPAGAVAGWACAHWKAPPCHGARHEPTSRSAPPPSAQTAAVPRGRLDLGAARLPGIIECRPPNSEFVCSLGGATVVKHSFANGIGGKWPIFAKSSMHASSNTRGTSAVVMACCHFLPRTGASLPRNSARGRVQRSAVRPCRWVGSGQPAVTLQISGRLERVVQFAKSDSVSSP